MKTFTVRNVPDETIERVRTMAKERGCELTAVVLEAIEHELDRWELHKRVQEMPSVEGVDPTALIREERNARDQAGL